MTSQPGQHIIILYNISRSKETQAMKIGPLMECNVKIIFLKNLAEKEAEKLVLYLFFYIKKISIGPKQVVCTLV